MLPQRGLAVPSDDATLVLLVCVVAFVLSVLAFAAHMRER